MRFSLWLPARRRWTDLLAMAGHAAATGWDGIWLADEPDQGSPPAVECWTALAALARSLPGPTLGGLVSDDWHRHPAVVTKIATTVDLLSSGRVVLGLMPGSQPDAFARLEESFQVVKCLGESDRGATMEGRFFRLHDAPLDPKPVQRPFPLVIWAEGDERSLAIAARYGACWATSGRHDGLQERVAALHQACQAIDRDPGEVAVSYVARLPRPESEASVRAIVTALAAAGAAEWIVDGRNLEVDRGWRDTLDRFMAEAPPP